MGWLQRWTGNIYAKLYSEFGRSQFTLSQALSATGMDEPRLAVAFSKLHSSQALIVFKRSRPRVYRLLDPRSFLLAEVGAIAHVGLRQEQYLQLVCDSFRALRERMNLISLAVYGSVARGEAGPLSDLDLLVVSDDFHGSLASRIDGLSFVESEVKDELAFTKAQGYGVWLSLYPLRSEEAQRMPVLFLDMTEDAKMVYDRELFLSRTLSVLRAKLASMGARRVGERGRRYWDLAPAYRQGQVLEV